MNKFKGLTLATESKILFLTKGYFPKKKKKSCCIYTDVKELYEHIQQYENKK